MYLYLGILKKKKILNRKRRCSMLPRASKPSKPISIKYEAARCRSPAITADIHFSKPTNAVRPLPCFFNDRYYGARHLYQMAREEEIGNPFSDGILPSTAGASELSLDDVRFHE